jgi:hypothetical protein
MSPSLLPSSISAKFQTVIRYVDVAGTGNSGAGVFDAEKKCVLGIISRKVSSIRTRQINEHSIRESYDIAKYFVRASVIAQFIPANVRFSLSHGGGVK